MLSSHFLVVWFGICSALGNAQNNDDSSNCSLACPTGIECVMEAPDRDNHPAAVFSGWNPITGKSATTKTAGSNGSNNNNMHCACPKGLSGLTCDVVYESCTNTDDDTGHKCYNGGKCVPGQVDDFGNDQLFCDCTDAYDEDNGIQYVGKNCENAVVIDEEDYNDISSNQNENDVDKGVSVGVNCEDNPEGFCLNGGVCNDKYPSFGAPCLCTTGYSGPRCEYEDGTVPDCNLPCQNGGHCVLGPLPDQQHGDTYAALWRDIIIDNNGNGKNDLENMHCECPDEFDGPFCNVEREPCGGHYCYYGSQCMTQFEDGQVVYRCDCNAANTVESSYAGRYCQYEAEEYCTKSSGINGHLFCVNGGKCLPDIYSGCDCPPGFHGFSCEFYDSEEDVVNTSSGNDIIEITEGSDFVDNTAGGNTANDNIGGFDFSTGNAKNPEDNTGNDDTGGFDGFDFSTGNAKEPEDNTTNGNTGDLNGFDVSTGNVKIPKEYVPDGSVSDIDAYSDTSCDLKCVHGVCRNGIKMESEKLADVVENTQHLSGDAYTEYMYCVCPDEKWTGPLCDVPVETCNDGKHLCLHGGKCVAEGDEQSCDCDDAESDSTTYFAGDHCEHPVNDVCTINPNPIMGRPLSFCVNGGVCKEAVDAREPHPGCFCKDGFFGPHCELRESASNRPATQWGQKVVRANDEKDRSPLEVAVLVISIIAVLTVGIFGASMYLRHRKRRNDAISNTINWANKYHDNPDDQVNIAPRRSSALSEVYPLAAANGSIRRSVLLSAANRGKANSLSSSRDPMATHLAPAAVQSLNVREELRNVVSDSDDDEDDQYKEAFRGTTRALVTESSKPQSRVKEHTPQIYIGPPRDEDGHELHNVEIV